MSICLCDRHGGTHNHAKVCKLEYIHSMDIKLLFLITY
jgi:hypothetical protein